MARRIALCIASIYTLLTIDITLLTFSTSQVATKRSPRRMYFVLMVISNIVLPLLFSLLRKAYKLKTKEEIDKSRIGMQSEEADEEFLRTLTGLPTRFRYQELEDATDKFFKVLGRGGFGSVYEGRLPDGCKVAVKKLEKEGRGQKEFCAEVATISRIHHVNLVCLKGFCSEGSQRLLVYEFMQNGSLDKWLFRDKQESGPLDWKTRFAIALDTARGLAYLHEGCHDRILHFDVKPQNILLDEHFHAKVADFGLSRSMDRDQSRLVTTMRGTPGYIAPEWLLDLGIDSKIDVYSYGMVLLELVSGRKNVDHAQDSDNWYLPAAAFRKAKEGRVTEIIDRVLVDSVDQEQAQLTIRIALWCIQESAIRRPSMVMVVQMLEGNLEVMEPPPCSTFLCSTSLGVRPVVSIAIPSESLTLVR